MNLNSALLPHNKGLGVGILWLQPEEDVNEAEVAAGAGRDRSASDVVRSALRLLEDRETQLRALREVLRASERSGTRSAHIGAG
ncbi:Antitoxin ParD1 [Mycobacterium simulans]|uniref:Antitoxin ParD1 n=1 Tax=Mycobacterium simulans TaxID=627089 RepID=A0A7Z7IR31_9MYCO|nr:Antitoxin ParD1 [Mycobacterium simulans]